jgi:dihydropteroate synthase
MDDMVTALTEAIADVSMFLRLSHTHVLQAGVEQNEAIICDGIHIPGNLTDEQIQELTEAFREPLEIMVAESREA